MKKEYSIINAYSYNDKKTNEKKFVVQGILQTQDFAVKAPRSIYFTEEEFIKLFAELIDDTRYDFGLTGVMVEVEEIFSIK